MRLVIRAALSIFWAQEVLKVEMRRFYVTNSDKSDNLNVKKIDP